MGERRTMTNRITEDKLDGVSEIIEQLNKELSPLVVKAILIDPMMLKHRAQLTEQARIRLLDKVIEHIHEIASMVVEQ